MMDDPQLAADLRDATPLFPTHVVGIGASAGGLDALERFFDRLPPDTGAAFVVVQHLSPDFKSLMDEILARRTSMPIHLVEDGVAVAPNHIYLIPPKKEMIISSGRLLLSERPRDNDLSLPIDVFFKSLAQDCGPRAVAIVLSGGGTDGSRGVRAVHEAGGFVIVQDEDSAQFDGMPKTARDAGVADWVLPPEQMPRVLRDHVMQLLTVADDPVKSGMEAVYKMLEEEFGLDFTVYKPSTVTRRIERRLQLTRLDNIDKYVERLKQHRSELDVLYRDLLIGVTRFFRNADAFKLLEDSVLPELLARDQKSPLRVWVAGCATGEEVYSLAVLCHELAPRFGNRPVKIFATDVHKGSLEVATRALYSEESVSGMSPERLQRYFIKRGEGFQIVPDLRQMVVFAPHNVIKDAPFTRIDLISCRNLLIYLQPPAQQKVLGLFHFALNKGGVLLLGPSESPGPLLSDYETIDKRWRMYRKYSDVRVRVEQRLQPSQRPGERVLARQPAASFGRGSVAQLLGVYDALLNERMPPSLLLNDRGELVHSFAGASKFLKLHDGRLGLDAADMAEGDLKVVLTGGLQRALASDDVTVYNGVQLADGLYRISISRVVAKGPHIPHVLFTFEQTPPLLPARVIVKDEVDLRDISRDRLDAVELELSHTKESLQAASEELESSNEELQAANEELLASNEELQSTNEELQSVNEELYSVNAEYQRKIADLTELTNDMENLLSSTEIGTIFLDRDLRIRKFTPQVAETFNLLAQDVGRSIETFTHNIEHPEMLGDLRRVANGGAAIERELRDVRGRSFFMRVLPYRAKGTIDGVVLNMIDVSGLKAAEDALFHERYLLNSLLDTVPDAIYFKDSRGRYIRANRAMMGRLGVGEPREVIGRTVFELLADREAAMWEHQQDEVVLSGGLQQNYRLERRGENWDLVTRLPLRDRQGATVGIIGIFRDISETKRSQEKIQEAVQRRDQFLAMLSHELRNPLGAVTTAMALLQEGNGDKERLLHVVDRQTKHMGRLLDDLLEASRVTQNKIELRQRLVDLSQILRDSVEATHSLLEERGIELTVGIDAGPLHVFGDEARLLQIHVNLLTNAAKYTPRGGHVWLHAQRDNHAVVIRVRDDGMGIPKALIDQVFELFVQARSTIDRSDGGLGVGLTLVKAFVEMHGGIVSVRSDGEGKGSEFIVCLPLASPVQAEMTLESSPRARVTAGAKIVVVEDNADGREMLCSLLALSGYDCQTAQDGEEGLTLIQRVKPDAAIIDLGLPRLDGLELARRLRADPCFKHTHLIALTGYGMRVDRDNALAAGFDDHLVKPVDARDLLRALNAS